jgi:VanZ family protein
MRKHFEEGSKFVLKYWLPVVIWALVIFSFSSNPTVKTSEIHWQDFIVKKTAHLVEYFIFSLILYRALINSKVSPVKALVTIVIVAFLYGATDEWHQSFTPGREPRLRDVLIDTTGAFLFVFSIKKLVYKNEKLLRLAKMIQLVR